MLRDLVTKLKEQLKYLRDKSIAFADDYLDVLVYIAGAVVALIALYHIAV